MHSHHLFTDSNPLTAVFATLLPEEVGKIGRVNKAFLKASRANSYWSNATAQHFPAIFENHAQTKDIKNNWFSIFSKAYQASYLTVKNGKVISVLISGKMPEIIALELTHEKIIDPFANINSIIGWAINNKNKLLIDYLFEQSIIPFFKTSKQDKLRKNLAHWATHCNYSSSLMTELINEEMLREQDKKGKTPLNYATPHSCPELFQLFYSCSNSLLASFRVTAATPLTEAANWNHIENVQVMLEHEATLDNFQHYIDYALFDATNAGNAIIRLLLNVGANPTVLFKDKYFQNYSYSAFQAAMHNSASKDRLKLFAERYLADVIEPWGQTSMLQLMVEECNIDAVARLLKMGADPNHQDKQSLTPLVLAMNSKMDPRKRLQLTEMLLKHGAKCVVNNRGFSPLSEAARLGHLDEMRLMIAHGADVNAPYKKQFLMHEIGEGLDDNEEELLAAILAIFREAGGNLTAKTSKGLTVLNTLLTEVKIKLFLKICELDHENLFGLSPLHLACLKLSKEEKNTVCISHLTVNQTDISGYTPLHLAAAFGSEHMVTDLLAAGANVDMQDNAGLTPLHLATFTKTPNKLIINALLDKGAYIHAVSEHFEASPFMLAESILKNEADSSDDEEDFIQKKQELNKTFAKMHEFNAVGMNFNNMAVVESIIHDLLPEDIFQLQRVSKRVTTIIKNNQSLWLRKMKIHFPHHLPTEKESGYINWYDTFKKIYRTEYFIEPPVCQEMHIAYAGIPMTNKIRRLFSAVKEGKISTIANVITPDELKYAKDARGITLLGWMQRCKRQSLLDEIYHHDKINLLEQAVPVLRAIMCHQPLPDIIQIHKEYHVFPHLIRHCAATNGNLEVIKWLVVNDLIQPKNDHDLLEQAAGTGHADIVAYLYEHGAHHEISPHLLMKNGHSDVLKLVLPRNKTSFEIPVQMLERGHIQTASVVWPYRQQSTWNDEAMPALFINAARAKQAVLIEFLLKMGIDHQAAFKLAAMNGFMEAMKILIKYPLNTYTIMLDMLLNHDWLHIDGLLKLNISLCARDQHKHTFVMIAAHRGDETLLAKLLTYEEGRYSLHRRDKQHNTALMWAAYHGSPINVQMLLDAGATIFNTNTQNETAMGIAITRNNHLAAKLLIQKYLIHFEETKLSQRTFVGTFWGYSRMQQIQALEGLHALLDTVCERGLGEQTLLQAVITNLHELGNNAAMLKQGALGKLFDEIIKLDVNAVLLSKEMDAQEEHHNSYLI